MKNKLFLMFCLCSVFFFISSCSFPSTNQQGPSPADITATYGAMVIDAMKSAIAEITLEAQLNPSATNTFTPIPPTNTSSPTPVTPTATNTELPPTNTPLPPTSTATTTPTITPTRSDFNCQLVTFSPELNRVYPPGGDFDGRWTFKNTGSEIWEKDKVDFIFISGTRFQEDVDKIDLVNNVNKGDSVEFIVDMLAPKTAGSYSASWGLTKDNVVFCSATIQIIVK